MSAVSRLPVVLIAERDAPRAAERYRSDGHKSDGQASDGAAAGRPERRLAAILMADVAGYSRLVGADEHGTLKRWRAHWDELIAPTIVAHHGRIARVTGDGILTEFASVVNAVECAVALQAGMRTRNAAVAEAERIRFRIGINIGDVIIDRGDMWGEGVNLAARLEALAEPGGICVSSRVANEVANKLPIAFEDLGLRRLKNIAREVRILRARLPGLETDTPAPIAALPAAAPAAPTLAAPAAKTRRFRLRPTLRVLVIAAAANAGASLAVAAAWWLMSTPPRHTPALENPFALAGTAEPASERLAVPSLVVLPFANLSGEGKDDYIADGITDSLISDLARALPDAFVVSRNTAFTYKNRSVDARQVGRELEVRYLLAGSVALAGEQVRVNVELLATQDGSRLWAERFDTERMGLFQLQDEIVGRLSRATGLKVLDIEAGRSVRERPDSAELVDLVLRGKAALNRPSTPASMQEARALFEHALMAQPMNPDALAGIATTLVFEFINGYVDTDGAERLQRAETLLAQALARAPHHLTALKARAALKRAEGQFDDAIAGAEAVIAEHPGEPWAYKEIGLDMLYRGRAEEALGWFDKADRIGPRDPGRWTWLDGRGHALILLGRDEDAVRALTAALEANPKSSSSRAFLAAAYAQLDRGTQAQAALAAFNTERPGTRIATFRTRSPVPLALTSAQYQQQYARLREGLRKAGMPE